MSQKKPLLLTLLLMALLSTYFWGDSRYPALGEKALMGSDAGISGIGFEILVPVHPNDGFIKQVYATAVNWVYSNLEGMTFGILFGALLMVLVNLIYQQYQQKNLPKTLLGGIMGIPLGVCVNCATPIAQGIYSSGVHPKTALALLFSSPTLNAIVISIMFALLPFHIVVVKLVLTGLFIFIILPLLVDRFVTNTANIASEELLHEVNIHKSPLGTKSKIDILTGYSLAEGKDNNFFNAAIWVIQQFTKNLLFILRVSLPLMLVAGLLGAIVITVIPFEKMATLFPVANIFYIALGMLVIAVIALFLPVPMSFDVIISIVLLANGLPVYYAATLLFALGIFSVYPFSIIVKTFSKKLAFALAICLTLLSVLAGFISYQWEEWNYSQQETTILADFKSSESAYISSQQHAKSALSFAEIKNTLSVSQLTYQPANELSNAQISVAKIPFVKQQGQAEKWQFTTVFGSDIGIRQQDDFSPLKLIPFTPFMYSRGIATGDVHNDGWDDIVIASMRGFNLYANKAGQSYMGQKIDIDALSQYRVMLVALVDINNDGWLDIYFTSFKQGNFVIYNQNGAFSENALVKLPNETQSIATTAASFADYDRDGDLDIAEGNVSQLFQDTHHDMSASRNQILIQDSGDFISQVLYGEAGETNSLLFTDFNNDHNIDLLVGNDFYEHDYFYVGDGKGGVKAITKEDRIIPYSTTWTMSMATADINNDLVPEMYIGQISDAPASQTFRSESSLQPELYCAVYEGNDSHYQDCLSYTTTRNIAYEAYTKRNLFHCETLQSKDEQHACVGRYISFISRVPKNPRDLCEYYPDNWADIRELCQSVLLDKSQTNYEQEIQNFLKPSGLSKPIPSDRQFKLPPVDNLLLSQQANGQFAVDTERYGLTLGGWTWNAKFADLNNDQWQDIYLVNGAFQFAASKTSNLLYVNKLGRTFKESASDVGLQSIIDTVSYSYNDYDMDGDIDIITVPSVGPIIVYKNEGLTSNSIAFKLSDTQGNHFGIGSKIIIYYDDDKTKNQMREIQAGGGFGSFDAPIVYFGLGEYQHIHRVEVRWSTGERSILDGQFSAGFKYKLERTK
jgi:uncharacterized membrane protein YraQ (UPF0718 family)